MNKIYLALLLIAASVPYFVKAASLSLTASITSITSNDGKEESRVLNDEQAKLLEQFRIESRNIKMLTDDYYLHSDSFAIGLLKANKWNVGAASRDLKRILLWRRSNKIDKLGKADVDPKLLHLFPYRLTTDTKDGCPVLEMDVEKWLVPDFMESHEFVRDAFESFTKFGIQMFEKARLAVKNNEKCDQGVFLVNVKGFSSKNYAEANTLSASVLYSTTYEHYYPHLFKKIILLNSPPEFTNFMSTLLPYLGQTSKYISLFSIEEKEQAQKLIHRYIDPEQLSQDYLGVKDA